MDIEATYAIEATYTTVNEEGLEHTHTHFVTGVSAPHDFPDSIKGFQLAACAALSSGGVDFIADVDTIANALAINPEDWRVLDHDSWPDPVRACISGLLARGEIDAEDVAVWCDTCIADIYDEGPADGGYIVKFGNREWLAAGDEDATAIAHAYAWDLVWAFNYNFIAKHIPVGYVVAEAMTKVAERLCCGANPAIQALIDAGSGKDDFCDAAIMADGRGHFLSSYDGKESEFRIDGVTSYYYRIN
jgi:hypothetical protein